MQKNKSKIAERSEIIDRGIRSNSRIQDIKHQCKKTKNFKEKRERQRALWRICERVSRS